MRVRYVLATVLALLAIGAPSAVAKPPEYDRSTAHNVVRDNGESCGFPVQWNINITANRVRFFDDQDRRTREIVHLSENNTIVNLATDKTLRERPVEFVRRNTYDPVSQRRTLIVDTGLMSYVNDQGERFRDWGEVRYQILPDGRYDIFSMVGEHPIYEALDGKPFTAVLGAFCGILD